jgi:hypothetical protein
MTAVRTVETPRQSEAAKKNLLGRIDIDVSEKRPYLKKRRPDPPSPSFGVASRAGG